MKKYVFLSKQNCQNFTAKNVQKYDTLVTGHIFLKSSRTSVSLFIHTFHCHRHFFLSQSSLSPSLFIKTFINTTLVSLLNITFLRTVFIIFPQVCNCWHHFLKLELKKLVTFYQDGHMAVTVKMVKHQYHFFKIFKYSSMSLFTRTDQHHHQFLPGWYPPCITF